MVMMLQSRQQEMFLKRQARQQEQKRQDSLNPPAPELTEGMASGMQSLAQTYSRSYGQARQANEARYDQMLKIADQERTRQQGDYRRMLGTIGATSGQRAADIRSEGVGEQANIMQRLARQGMAGSTIGATQRAGVRRGTSAKLNRLSDTMLQQKLGVMRQQAAPQQGARLGIMERRTDAYPDAGALTGAFGAIGQGYGGSGMTAMLKSLTKMQR